jgi:hypothetical protein
MFSPDPFDPYTISFDFINDRFAVKTDNASAFVRAVELRGKLTGILVDRVDARVAIGTFALNVTGLALPDGGDRG